MDRGCSIKILPNQGGGEGGLIQKLSLGLMVHKENNEWFLNTGMPVCMNKIFENIQMYFFYVSDAKCISETFGHCAHTFIIIFHYPFNSIFFLLGPNFKVKCIFIILL